MRRIICIMLCLAVLVGAAACNKKIDPVGPDETPVPISTNSTETEPAETVPATPVTDDPEVTDDVTAGPTEPPVTDIVTGAPETVVPTNTPSSAPSTPKPTAAPNVSCHPYPTDPTEIRYAEAGKALMRKLMAMPEYENLNINARRGYPYMIAINKAQYKNTITVYCVDENGQYTRPYLAIVCSAGNATPLGVYNTRAKYSWHQLVGPCYGQYCTRIYENFLFHSVPYYTMHKYDLEYKQYNKLGRLASLGCVRLPCNDAKWIYDNCPIGTQVVIYSDSSSAGPMGQPTPLRLDVNDIFMRGWDPTDPDRYNPWGDEYKAGYTIRSEIARADYEYAMAHHLWDGTINRPEQPTPTPNMSPTPTPTAEPTPTSEPTPVVTPTAEPTPTQQIPTPGPILTPTPVPSETPKPTPEPTPRPTPTAEPTPAPTAAPTEPPESVSVPFGKLEILRFAK